MSFQQTGHVEETVSKRILKRLTKSNRPTIDTRNAIFLRIPNRKTLPAEKMEELEVVYEGEGEGQSLNWKFALSQIGVANKDNITGDDMFGGFAVHN